jgi:hypothetical protein
MTRTILLTDALLREALTPADDVAPPVGVLAAIAGDVRTTPQARRRLVPLIGLPRVRLPGVPEALADSRRLGLVLGLVALLIALVGGAIVGAALLAPRRTPLNPTGLVVISEGIGLVDRVVVDGAGRTWAIAPGGVARFDAATGERRTWTAADDPAFSQAIVAPARAGGLWVLARGTIRRFDGEGFLDTMPSPVMNPTALVEAEDGVLWLSAWDAGLHRWDGRSWTAAPPGRPTDAAGFLAVMGPGDIWVANPGPGQAGEEGPANLGVSHLVEGSWVTYDATDAPQLALAIGAIERAADGSIWVTGDGGATGANPGIARFDGTAWTTVPPPEHMPWWLAAAPDGAMWTVTSDASGGGVARWTDGTWRTFGTADGVGAAEMGTVSVTPTGPYLGTATGLLRFEGDRWVPAWPDAAAGPMWTMPQDGQLAAISATEAWAVDDTALWHWTDGAWVGPVTPVGFEGWAPTRLALAPDGALWVASSWGVAVLRDERWAVASRVAAQRIAAGRDGSAWIGTDTPNVLHLVPVGGGYDATAIECPLQPWTMTVAADGTPYLGDLGYSTTTPGLARIVGDRCGQVALPADANQPAVTALVADPRGGVVVEGLETVPEHPGGGQWHGRLMRVVGDQSTVLIDEGEVTAGLRVRHVDVAGRVWRTPCDGDYGLWALDGARWVPLVHGANLDGAVSVARDGAVFVLAPGSLYRWLPDPELLPAPRASP